MSEPNVNVLKAPVRSRTNVRTLTSMAMLTALAYVVMLLSKMLPQVQHFLQMDLKDTIICIGGFLFGPLSAAVISIGLIWIPKGAVRIMEIVKDMKTVFHLSTLSLLLLSAVMMVSNGTLGI